MRNQLIDVVATLLTGLSLWMTIIIIKAFNTSASEELIVTSSKACLSSIYMCLIIIAYYKILKFITKAMVEEFSK